MKKMSVSNPVSRIIRAVIGNDVHGFYVKGSGPVWVPNVRSHEIPKVIAEHHWSQVERDSRWALRIGRH